METTDEVTLRGVRAFGRHGVFEHERIRGQDFFVDAVLRLDTRPAAHSDDVADTVHYGEVAELIVALVGAEPVNLIETLASRIADELLGLDPVQSVSVTVHKPNAPIPVPFDDAAVTVHRTRVLT